MSNAEQIQQVELSIEQARSAVNKMKAFDTLRNTKEFKEVIEEGYFKEEASRVVLLRADTNMQDPDSQKELDNQIIAIGYFREYFRTIYNLGHMAEKAIAGDEQTLEDLNKEGLEA